MNKKSDIKHIKVVRQGDYHPVARHGLLSHVHSHTLHKPFQLQYSGQPVEALKRLCQEVNPEHAWDLSVDTLRQVKTYHY